jgi:SAM-dependent methyltransferase
MTEPALRRVLDAEREIMNELAPFYDELPNANSHVYRRERAAFVAWLLETLRRSGAKPETQRFLDAGCGPGELMGLLARAGCEHLTGLDLAEAMLHRAQTLPGPAPGLVRACIEAPPFAGPHFDVIVAGFTVHHMLEPRAFFRLVDRVLRPGGWFFLLEYDAEHFDGRLRKLAVEPWAALLRRVLRFKNRAALARHAGVALRFNPAHTLRSFEEILAAMPRPESYAIERHPRGMLSSAVVTAVDGDSGFDRALVRRLEDMDRWLCPRFGGSYQWIAGQRGRS